MGVFTLICAIKNPLRLLRAGSVCWGDLKCGSLLACLVPSQDFHLRVHSPKTAI